MTRSDDALPGWSHRFGGRVFADRETVLRLLAEIELWPTLIPHVRSVRVLRRDGNRRLVAVRTSWRGLSIGWRAIETVDAAAGQVTLRHISWLSRGSVAVWNVGPTQHLDDGRQAVDVTVDQRVRMPLAVIGDLLTRRHVGACVAQARGQVILDRVKHVAEGGSLAGRD